MGDFLKRFFASHLDSETRFCRYMLKAIYWIIDDFIYSIKIYFKFLLIIIGAGCLFIAGILLPFLVSEKNMLFFDIQNPNIFDMIKIILEDRSNFDKIFAPASALFSGISSLVAVILLFLQVNMISHQRREANKSILDRWIYQMSLAKTELIKEITVNSGEITGSQSFKYFSQIINNALNILADRDYYAVIQSSKSDIDDLYEYIYDMMFTKYDITKIIWGIDLTISKISSYTINSYYHNVYTTLKMIYEDTNITYKERRYYMRIYRSQFTHVELGIIYIHALTIKDDNELKFKNIIEKTGFFHSFNNKPIWIKTIEEKFPEISYKASAFRS